MISKLYPFLPSIVIIYTLNSCQDKVPLEKTDEIDYVAALYSNTQVIGNIEYAKIDSISLRLDSYIQTKRLGEPPWVEYSDEMKPTLLFLHGGGWTSGSSISRSLFVMPYVSRGWNIVTANYRHLDQTDLAGCIGDSRLALNWIYDNAAKYKFDTTRVVVSGESAGGHLSLMAGLIKDNSPFVPDGSINHELKVAAIVNWFGVADLEKASETWSEEYILEVVKDINDKDRVLQLASPIHYLNTETPPIMTIHGDQDKAAPYNQGVLLHEKLNELGLTNYFLTIPGKKHGNFDEKEMTMIQKEIWKFLGENGF